MKGLRVFCDCTLPNRSAHKKGVEVCQSSNAELPDVPAPMASPFPILEKSRLLPNIFLLRLQSAPFHGHCNKLSTVTAFLVTSNAFFSVTPAFRSFLHAATSLPACISS